MDISLGSLSAALQLDMGEFNTSLKSIPDAFKRVASQIQNSINSINLDTLNKKMKKVGSELTSVGKDLSAKVTLPLAALGGASVSASAEFEDSMSQIVGLVGVASEQVDAWKNDLLANAADWGVAPTKLADALFFVTSAGLRGTDAMEALEYSAKASASGLGETAVIADLLTSAMNAYGPANLSAAQATDILVTAVKEGKAPADALAGALGDVLPIASEMGVTFDQVAAATAAMTRTGTDASTANTQLKAILSSLKKPADQSEKMLRKMGTSSQELRDKIRKDGLLSVLGELKDKTNEFGEEALATVFPNIRALSGVLDLMGSNAADNVKVFDSLKNATGALNTAFTQASTTTKSKWNKAIATAETSAIVLGDSLKDVLTPILEGLTATLASVTDWFVNLSDGSKTFISIAGVIAASLGPVSIAIGFLATSVLPGLISTVGSAIKVFNTLKLALLSNPITAVAVAIGVATAAIIAFTSETSAAEAAQESLNDVRKQAAASVVKEKVELEELMRVAKNENASKEQRRAAIQKINEILPDYVGTINEETIATGEAGNAINTYIQSLERKARIEAAQSSLVELEKERITALMEGNDNSVEWYKTAGNLLMNIGSAEGFVDDQISSSKKNAAKSQELYNSKKQALLGLLDEERKKEAELQSLVKTDSPKLDSPIVEDTEDTDTPAPPTNTGSRNGAKQDYLAQLEFERSLLGKTAAEQRAMTVARSNDVEIGSEQYQKILELTQAITEDNSVKKEQKDILKELEQSYSSELELIGKTAAEQKAMTIARENDIEIGSEQYQKILELTQAYTNQKDAVNQKEVLKNNISNLQQSLLTQEQIIEQSYAKRQEMIQQAISAELISQQEGDALFSEIKQRQIEELGKLGDAGESAWMRMASATVNWEDAAMGAMVSIASQLGSVFVDMEGGWKGMVDTASQLGSVFVDMEGGWKGMVDTALNAIQQVINQLFAQALAGMIAGEASKGLVGLATAAVGLGALKALWNKNTKVQGLWTGGEVTKSGAFLVGERGPEMVSLPAGSAVTPNHSLNNMGGGELKARVSGRDLEFVLEQWNAVKGRV
jgi:TP901 family phage tail tape measure protein